MKGLTVGRMVHFVLMDNPKGGSDHRAGVVNEVHDDEFGTAGITIFLQEGDYSPHGLHTRQVIGTYSETMEPGSWHWIEPA